MVSAIHYVLQLIYYHDCTDLKVHLDEFIFEFCIGGAPFSTGALWHTSGSGIFCNDDVIIRARWDNHGSQHIYHIGVYHEQVNNLVLEVGEWWDPSENISYINRLGLHHVAVIPIDRNSRLHGSPYHWDSSDRVDGICTGCSAENKYLNTHCGIFIVIFWGLGVWVYQHNLGSTYLNLSLCFRKS